MSNVLNSQVQPQLQVTGGFPFYRGQWMPGYQTPVHPTPLLKKPADSVSLSTQAQLQAPSNKNGVVTVEPWGTGKNDCLENILKTQGYSVKEIYAKDETGRNLIQQMADLNNLRNPDIVAAGRELKLLPSKDARQSPEPNVNNVQQTELSNESQEVDVYHGCDCFDAPSLPAPLPFGPDFSVWFSEQETGSAPLSHQEYGEEAYFSPYNFLA